MNIPYFKNRIQQKMLVHHQKSLIRKRVPVFIKKPHYHIANKTFTTPFCTNDYLGLSQHPALIKIFKETVDEFGIGSTASQFIFGYTSIHQEFEIAFAKFMNYERALLFGSGYLANLGVISTFAEKNDVILMDKFNHASLIDGAKLSDSHFKRYLHNNMDNLFKLTNTIVDSKLIISDGIFSMTGEIAKIPQLTELSRKTNSLLIIDDTHGVGVFGKHGSGTCSHFSLTQNDVHLITASLGKAFGNYGAMVCGSQLMIEYLEQFARTSMFSTATPAALAAAGIKAIEIIQEETWRREKLHHLISFFNMTAYELSLPILKSISPIQIIPIADNKKVLKISDHLKTVGYTVAAIRAPTVPPNHTCLRITLTCLHNENQIVDLLKIIKNELVSS